jgi:hypothetical protein
VKDIIGALQYRNQYRLSKKKVWKKVDEKYYQNTFIAYDNERRVQQHQILEIENEDFRNSVGTMDETGKRKWIFPENPKENIPITGIIPAMLY